MTTVPETGHRERIRELNLKIHPAQGTAAFITVVIFTLAFSPARSCQAGEFRIESGPGVLSRDYSEGTGVILSRIWEDTFALSVGFFSDQKFNHIPVDENTFVMVHWMATYRRLQLGFGATFWEKTNRALGQRFTYQERIGFRFYGNWDINYRHWSNGRAAKPNAGQNILSIGYTF